jgi:hypothetical protein
MDEAQQIVTQLKFSRDHLKNIDNWCSTGSGRDGKYCALATLGYAVKALGL